MFYVTVELEHIIVYMEVPLLKDTLWRGHPSKKDTNSSNQVPVHVPWMHMMLPLAKGHLW